MRIQSASQGFEEDNSFAVRTICNTSIVQSVPLYVSSSDLPPIDTSLSWLIGLNFRSLAGRGQCL